MNKQIKIDPQLFWSILLLILAFLVFLFLEKAIIVKIIFSVLVIMFCFLTLVLHQEETLLYLVFFLTSLDIYYLFHILFWPLWSVMLVFIISSSLIGYLLIYQSRTSHDLSRQLLYLILQVLILLEIFLSLIPWTIDSKAKTMVILMIFYLYWETVTLRLKNQLSIKKISPSLVISLIIITVIIITSSWYGY